MMSISQKIFDKGCMQCNIRKKCAPEVCISNRDYIDLVRNNYILVTYDFDYDNVKHDYLPKQNLL